MSLRPLTLRSVARVPFNLRHLRAQPFSVTACTRHENPLVRYVELRSRIESSLTSRAFQGVQVPLPRSQGVTRPS